MSVASFGLGTIRSTLYLDTQQYKLALQQATGMTRQAVAKNNKILALQSGSANVGMAAAMGATIVAPMFAMVNRIQQVYEEYDKVLGKIQTVSKATAQEMAVLNKSFIANGKAFGETPTNMAKAGYVSAQAMFTSFKEMKKVSEASAKLRLASGGEITTEQSADSLTRMLQAFSLGVSQIDEINDILLKTRDVGAVSMDALADSVKNVASAYAQAFPNRKMESFKEMMAMMASGTQAGMDPSVMATGLRGMLARVYTESNKPKSAMNALAVSKGFQNAASMLKDGAIPFLRIVQDASGGYLELLNALGYERREMSGVAAVIRGGMKHTEEAFRMIKDSKGALDEASERMKQTWWYVKNTFMAAKESMILSFGPAVVKMLMRIAGALTKVFNYLEKLPESTKEFIVMAGAVTTLRIAISALSGALQIMGIRWASIIPGMSLVMGMMSGKGGAGAGAVRSFGKKGFVGKTPNFGMQGAYANAMAVGARGLLPSMYKKEGKSWVTGGIGTMGAATYGNHFPDAEIGMPMVTPVATRTSLMKSAGWQGASASGRLGKFANSSSLLASLYSTKKMMTPKAIAPNLFKAPKLLPFSPMAFAQMNRNASFAGTMGNAVRGVNPVGMLKGSLDKVSTNVATLALQLTGLRKGTPSVLARGATAGRMPFYNATAWAGRGVKSAGQGVWGGLGDVGLSINKGSHVATRAMSGVMSGGASAVMPGLFNIGKLIGKLAGNFTVLTLAVSAGMAAWKIIKRNFQEWTGVSILDGLDIGLEKIQLALDSFVYAWEVLFADVQAWITVIKNYFKYFFRDVNNSEESLAYTQANRDAWKKASETKQQAYTDAFEKKDPNLFASEEDYFKQAIDKMVKDMSPDGKIGSLDQASKQTIIDAMLSPIHKFKLADPTAKEGFKRMRDYGAYDVGIIQRIAPELMQMTMKEFFGDKLNDKEIQEEGLPQFAEEVKIKLGEIADALTLGSAEAWKAIVPKYYVEEKSLKNQQEQLKLSSEHIRVSKDIKDNTARIGTGGTLVMGNLG